ncbi:MAG TPA: hypothetical protein VLA99_14375 [Nitrospiraceae bacterium]|nr:hypothetical protein [Nitrospiraceae bacterium]
MTSRATFLVVASSWDAVSRSFAERHLERGVRLLTPRDLSRVGWNCSFGKMGASSQAVVAGRLLGDREIHGVLTRLSGVNEHELPHIAAGDRTYVAAEMNAFLLAWLTTLPCPVLNRPTPRCLSGRWWRQEEWVRAAGHLGIPILPVHRRVRLTHGRRPRAASQPGGTTVTLIRRRNLGDADPLLITQARHLAQAAGTDFLAVRFAGPSPGSAFVDATPWPDIADDVIGEAVMECLVTARTGRQESQEAA